MLPASRDPLLTPRLELRRTRTEDAAACFEILRDPSMYAYIPRKPPTTIDDVATRFARITQETAPGRDEQWLNWTIWLRQDGAPIGMTEATVSPNLAVSIGYMLDPRFWRRGYAREAVGAMVGHLAEQGAAQFEATIDIRNIASRGLAASLGFALDTAAGIDETWRKDLRA